MTKTKGKEEPNSQTPTPGSEDGKTQKVDEILQSIKDLETANEEQKQTIVSLQKELEDKTKLAEKLQDDFEEKSAELNSNVNELKELREVCAGLQKGNEDLHNEVDTLNEEIEKYKELIAAGQNDKADYSKEDSRDITAGEGKYDNSDPNESKGSAGSDMGTVKHDVQTNHKVVEH